MSYPHVNTPYKQPSQQSPTQFTEKKELTMEEKINKIFFRTATIEKDLAKLLHASGMESSNKFLNNP